jgi:hypothetical protein
LAGFSSRLAGKDKPRLAQCATTSSETGHQNSCSGSLRKRSRSWRFEPQLKGRATMKKLLICLLGLPLALSGCVSDEEMAAPRSWGAQMIDEEQRRESIQGLTCSLGMRLPYLLSRKTARGLSRPPAEPRPKRGPPFRPATRTFLRNGPSQ